MSGGKKETDEEEAWASGDFENEDKESKMDVWNEEARWMDWEG